MGSVDGRAGVKLQTMGMIRMSKRMFLFAAGVAFMVAAPAAAMAQPDPSVFTPEARGLCAGMGLMPDEASFALCVVSLRESAAEAAAHGVPVHQPRAGEYPPSPNANAADFFQSTPPEQHAREARACEGLGLPAGSHAYWQCIANLDGMMFRVQLIGND